MLKPLPKIVPHIKDEVKSVTDTIRQAMRHRHIDVPMLTETLGLDKSQRGAVAHWVKGQNGPSSQMRPKLAEILGVSEDTLIAGGPSGGRAAANFNPPKPKKNLGPAQRAVALVAAHAPEILAPPPGPPPAQDVFVIRARTDGTMQVRLDANLPYAKGSQLVQYLLSFGLVIGADAQGD
jgi:hypothetical protein